MVPLGAIRGRVDRGKTGWIGPIRDEDEAWYIKL